jgi:D-alanine--poly(phosphoribitol) ligase subunit 2
MEEKVLQILEKLCGSTEIKNNMDMNLFEAGFLDSLGFIELLVAIEEKFGIDIEPTEVQREEIETPNKIIEYISRK